MPDFEYFHSLLQVNVKIISYLPEITKEKIMQLLPSSLGNIDEETHHLSKKNMGSFS